MIDKKSKWVIQITVYACGHELKSERHGFKAKWAEFNTHIVNSPGSCPSCYAKMMESEYEK